MPIGGHHSSRMKNDEWLTPPEIVSALGAFDLDPCSPVNRPWDTARSHYTVEDDGLSKPWAGRVWMNPPYGKHLGAWLAKLKNHGDGIALVFARTETRAFFDHVWGAADALLFIEGRIHFHHVDGKRCPNNSRAPSVLIAYGMDNAGWLLASKIPGAYTPLPSREGE